MLTLKIEGNSLSDMQKGLKAWAEAFGGQVQINGNVASPVLDTDSLDAAVKRAAKKTAAKAPEAEEEFELEDAEQEETEVEEADEPAVDLKMVTKAAQALMKDEGREAVAKVFKKFGAKNVNEIKKTDYAKVYSALSL